MTGKEVQDHGEDAAAVVERARAFRDARTLRSAVCRGDCDYPLGDGTCSYCHRESAALRGLLGAMPYEEGEVVTIDGARFVAEQVQPASRVGHVSQTLRRLPMSGSVGQPS